MQIAQIQGSYSFESKPQQKQNKYIFV